MNQNNYWFDTMQSGTGPLLRNEDGSPQIPVPPPQPGIPTWLMFVGPLGLLTLYFAFGRDN